MKVLLVGEYSRLHNSLKEGLEELNNDVFLVGMGDSFKQFDVDYNYDATTSIKPIFKVFNKLFFFYFNKDLAVLERGIRFLQILPKLKNYDVVQLINETPIQTFAGLERLILKKIIKQNKKVFLLSCGADYVSVKFALDNKLRYSMFDILSEHKSHKKYFTHSLKYIQTEFKKISIFLYKHINGVIASDFDYVLPLEGNPKFLGLIPNPINIDKIQPITFELEDKIIIFLGINRNAYLKKGIPFFEEALEIIKQKYLNKVEIVIAENLPYAEYINSYNRCHILLDQIYSYDQGYNALEAMAKGKVVFSGAEQEFLEYYNLKEDDVLINALPDTEYLVEKLSQLIENPIKLKEISIAAQAFIDKEHNYRQIAQKYLEVWRNN